ncbi:MAG: sulfite reductase (NADPH) hemoprotein beta-component [Gammaproteobacteria bacterium]|jgi:sulfite reductase (NADPH) hemoprotein beta-component
MYIYDPLDKTIVNERVEQYRDQVRRWTAGELSEEEFRPLRLQNGLYIQRVAPMLRVAIPYGTLRSAQLRMLGHIANKYDKGYGHISTRQNIQYNWPAVEDTPDILADLASVEMHAIQTSGNCIRNTTTDELAGVAADELEDPRPYCEMIRQWSTFHPEFAFLPRKFKIAVSASKTDRAATRLHDIGLFLVKNDAGETGFIVEVGGGQGRMPHISQVIYDFVPVEDILSCCEAIIRVYNQKGRRDNMHRARIKILVKAMGIEDFRAEVDQEWAQIRDTDLKIPASEITRMKGYFATYDVDANAGDDSSFAENLENGSAFARWIKQNTRETKFAGYRAVYVSLNAHGQATGDIRDHQLEALADLADAYSFNEARTTHDQNMVLPVVKQADLFELWNKMRELKLAMPNIGTLQDMIVCPGLDFCSLANAHSIPVADAINERFDDLDYLYNIGELKIKISGCMNACGHHHVGHIGILGVDKKGTSWYQITLGGDASNNTKLGERLGPAVAQADMPDVVEKLINVYMENRSEETERFVDTVHRIGVVPFKERVYPEAK